MNDTKQPIACNCTACPGPSCNCGCRKPAAQAACTCGAQCTCGQGCSCGPQLHCGPACSCPKS
jgi:hypothetical protein